MKKRMFTIGIIAGVPILAILFLFSQSLFFTPSNNALETYSSYEKRLGKLFDKYGKQSDTMTDQEFDAWQSEVEQVSTKAAKVMIKIQKDPEDWKTYLASTGQPYRPSLFAELEYTGLASKKLSEITSDQFDAWYEDRDRQRNDRNRAEMRAAGIWDDAKIEQMIARTNENWANNPDIQHTKKRMRELLISYEGREERDRKRAEEKRKWAEAQAEYKAKNAKDMAWVAAEIEKIAAMPSEPSDTPSEPLVSPDVDFDTFDTMPPSVDVPIPENDIDDIDDEGIQTSQQQKPPEKKPFNPDDFALRLSTDMSRWEDTLRQTYQDVFLLDTPLEQSLPEEARQYFQERKLRLQYEYVERLDGMITDTSTENRAETLRIIREKLSDNFDSDFAESVMRQLHDPRDE